MSEEMQMEAPKRSGAGGWVILAILISAIVFGAGGYYLGTKKADSTTSTATVTATTTTTVKSSGTAVSTADWKTYTNDTYGFSFKYPTTWSEPKIIKHNNIMGLKGTSFGTSNDTGPIKLDSAGIFSLGFNTKDYEAYDGKAIVGPISTNWTKEQFTAQNKNISPSVYKKLSDKAILLGYYSNVECSQSLALMVLTNLNGTYPNLEIGINGSFDNNQTIKDAEASAEKNNTDVCDLKSAYDQVAEKVQNGTYSDQLNSYIEIARQLADTVKAN